MRVTETKSHVVWSNIYIFFWYHSNPGELISLAGRCFSSLFEQKQRCHERHAYVNTDKRRNGTCSIGIAAWAGRNEILPGSERIARFREEEYINPVCSVCWSGCLVLYSLSSGLAGLSTLGFLAKILQKRLPLTSVVIFQIPSGKVESVEGFRCRVKTHYFSES